MEICNPLIVSDFSFQFQKLKFPPKVYFTMIINKFQGKTLSLAKAHLREDLVIDTVNFILHIQELEHPSVFSIRKNTRNVVYKEYVVYTVVGTMLFDF